MPYATIDEVWGGSFNNNPGDSAQYGYNHATIEPANMNPNVLTEDEVDDSYGPHMRYKKGCTEAAKVGNQRPIPISSKKPPQRTANYSRTYDRLAEHTGTVNRLGRVAKKAKAGRNGYYLDEDTEDPGYSNLDAPINKITKQLEEGYTELSDETGNSSRDEFLQELIEENKRLKALLAESGNLNGGSTKDNLFDLALYISTGIFIIILMETFSKSVRRF